MDVIEGGGEMNNVPGTEGERLPKDAEAKQSEAFAKRLDECGLKDGDKLGALFLTLHQALLHVGSVEGAAQVAALWYGTALRCLRCVGKYPVREMGLGLVQDAIRMQPHPNAQAYATAGMNRVSKQTCRSGSRNEVINQRGSPQCFFLNARVLVLREEYDQAGAHSHLSVSLCSCGSSCCAIHVYLTRILRRMHSHCWRLFCATCACTQHATPLMAKNKLGADLYALLSQGPAVAAFLESLFSER